MPNGGNGIWSVRSTYYGVNKCDVPRGTLTTHHESGCEFTNETSFECDLIIDLLFNSTCVYLNLISLTKFNLLDILTTKERDISGSFSLSLFLSLSRPRPHPCASFSSIRNRGKRFSKSYDKPLLVSSSHLCRTFNMLIKYVIYDLSRLLLLLLVHDLDRLGSHEIIN